MTKRKLSVHVSVSNTATLKGNKVTVYPYDEDIFVLEDGFVVVKVAEAYTDENGIAVLYLIPSEKLNDLIYVAEFFGNQFSFRMPDEDVCLHELDFIEEEEDEVY
ncbi:MAG: hypothetical protein F4X69_15885 [Gemmatimonadetes bacterium]|nr:hypothetical protein [Gemmatimonadota bacterium]